MAARKQDGLLSYFTAAKVCRDSEVVVNRDEINESVNSDHEDNNTNEAYNNNDDEIKREEIEYDQSDEDEDEDEDEYNIRRAETVKREEAPLFRGDAIMEKRSTMVRNIVLTSIEKTEVLLFLIIASPRKRGASSRFTVFFAGRMLSSASAYRPGERTEC